MKYILSIILFFLLAGSLSAQNEQDQVIFKAMQDEMQRSKEQLMLPGMQKPYYLSYTLGRTHQFEVDRKSTRLNSSHVKRSRMPSSA